MRKMRFTEIPDAKNNSVPYIRAHTVPCLHSEAELSDQHSSSNSLFCRDDRYFIQIWCQQLHYRSVETPNRGLIALHSYFVFERPKFLLSVQGPASRWLSFGWQSLIQMEQRLKTAHNKFLPDLSEFHIKKHPVICACQLITSSWNSLPITEPGSTLPCTISQMYPLHTTISYLSASINSHLRLILASSLFHLESDVCKTKLPDGLYLA
jgi:hypothetical protein